MKTRESPPPPPVHVHVPDTTPVHVHMRRSPCRGTQVNNHILENIQGLFGVISALKIRFNQTFIYINWFIEILMSLFKVLWVQSWISVWFFFFCSLKSKVPRWKEKKENQKTKLHGFLQEYCPAEETWAEILFKYLHNIYLSLQWLKFNILTHNQVTVRVKSGQTNTFNAFMARKSDFNSKLSFYNVLLIDLI